MKAYITKYQSVLSDAREAGDAIPETPAKDIILAHIKPDAYQKVTMNCRIDKISLSECMERCFREAVSVEANAASKARRAARAGTQDTTVSTGTAITTTGNAAGRTKTYKGKDINEYGFFKDRDYWGRMTAEQKSGYLRQQDKWVRDGLIFKKTKGGGATNNRKAVIKEAVTDMIAAIGPSPDSTPIETNSNPESNATVPQFEDERGPSLSMWSSPCNAESDSGADTCLLGSSFRMLSHFDRMATVSVFDENLIINDMKIGTGVTAFDKPDGETILVIVNEEIDHASQDNTLLSTNQLRHNGVDVCERHQKLIIQGGPGAFRIAVSGHELACTMEHSLTSLAFRYPTADELEVVDMKVVQLTSAAQWDPENLSGNDFLPGADMHYARKFTDHITDEVILDGDSGGSAGLCGIDRIRIEIDFLDQSCDSYVT